MFCNVESMWWFFQIIDHPKIDCFSALDGGINDLKVRILEENIEDAKVSLNSKNLDLYN